MPRALLIDVGGVLMPDYLTAAAEIWGNRLGLAPQAFLAALFAGSDDQILIGRADEDTWWRVIAARLQIDVESAAAIRADLAARQIWDSTLLAGLRRLASRATITIVSNAWPDMRTWLAGAGILDLADAVVLSCEAGCAKPDPRIYAIALDTIHAAPADALFIDDTPANIGAAKSLGLAAHLHTHTPETLTRINTFLDGAPRSGPA